MSPLRSSAGPAVCTNGTSSSAATIWASEVLPRPGRAGQQHVVERLAAVAGGRDRDRQLVLERLLADEVLQPARAAASARARSSPGELLGSWMRMPADRAHRRALRSACGDQLLGALAGGRRRAARRPRSGCSRDRAAPRAPATAGRRRAAHGDRRPRAASPPTFSRSSTMIRSAVRLPTPGAACKRARVAGGHGRQQLARRRRRRARPARPWARPTGRPAASGRARAPPRRRSRRAPARRRGRRGGCAASPRRRRPGRARSVSLETASR